MWPFREKRSLENPSTSLYDARAWAMVFGGGGESAAGINITPDVALGVPAIWSAINFIGGTIGSLPLQLFTETDKGRVVADKDPLYTLLHDAPNPEWSSFKWRKYSMTNTLLNAGRSYTFIERNAARRIKYLWPLDPTRTTVKVVAGQTKYEYRQADDKKVTYASDEIIDIPFMLSVDGVTHISPTERLKNAIGLSVALEQYASKFFQNGGVPPLALTGPLQSVAGAKRAGEDITDALKKAREEKRNVLVIPLGHELKPIGIDPEKSQMEEARRFQVEEVARFYNLPPVFLQDLTHGTFSNTEQQDLHFVKHTLTQWLEAWEQEMNLKLFSDRNTSNFVEFNVDGLLRGDFKTRMDGYATAIQNAVYTPDDARGFENMPKMGGDAAKLHIQGATVPLGEQGEKEPDAADPAEPSEPAEPSTPPTQGTPA